MTVIPKSVFEGRSDRLSYQYQKLAEGVSAGSGVGGGKHFSRVSEPDIYSVESDFIDHSHDFDQNYCASEVVADLSTFVNMINDDVSHVTGKGYADLDAYLSGVGLNVSHYYENVYHAIKGTHLNAINTFGPSVKMGTVEVTGATSCVFTDGVVVGTGSGKVSDTNYAGARVDIIVQTGKTITAETVARLSLTREGGDTTTEDVTIPAGAGDGSVVAYTVGVNYIDLTGVTIISGGTNSDEFDLYSALERVVSL